MTSSKYLQHTVGKRKTSIARIYLKQGNGEIMVNDRSLNDYYRRPTARVLVNQPLELTDSVGKYDIKVTVRGGGLSGQAGAVRHAIARALANIDIENRRVLKSAGLITRDARRKERKLPGQPGARKKFQFSKR